MGVGFSQTKNTYGATTTDTLVGVSLPMGQLTLYSQLGNRTKAGNASASSDTNYSGKIFTAVYSLSKRTDFFSSYKTWDVSSAATSTPSSFTAGVYHYF
jgi:predicted porin